MSEEKALVEYQARDGQRIKLTPAIIKKYLVSGRSEFVTDSELFMYMGLCKSRGLNPFIKDCHLVKYTPNEGAAIITSIDYYRKRARSQADCKGWTVGVVVQRGGELIYRKGCILLENEILIGGWAEAKPEGWTEPMRKEVNLKRYIKKTKDGNVTRFWSEDNQPEMIAKVAESQLLRSLWPDEFQGLYVDSEVQSRDAQDELSAAVASAPVGEPDQEPRPSFETIFADEIKDPLFSTYLIECGKLYRLADDQIREEFAKDAPQIKRLFVDWKQKAIAKAAVQAKATPATAPAAEVKAPEKQAEDRPAEAPATDPDPIIRQEAEAKWKKLYADVWHEAPPQPAEPAAAPKEKSFRDEWINLTGKGFGPYVNRNMERFKAADPIIRQEAEAKWKKLYADYPWPIQAQAPAPAGEVPKGEQQQIGGDPILDELRAIGADQHKKYFVYQAQKNLGFGVNVIPPSAEGRSRLLDEVNRLIEGKQAENNQA